MVLSSSVHSLCACYNKHLVAFMLLRWLLSKNISCGFMISYVHYVITESQNILCWKGPTRLILTLGSAQDHPK